MRRSVRNATRSLQKINQTRYYCVRAECPRLVSAFDSTLSIGSNYDEKTFAAGTKEARV